MAQPGSGVRRALLLALGLAAIIGGLAAIVGTRSGNAAFAAQRAAVERFAEMGKDSYRTGQPPRQTAPEVKAALDGAFDTAELSRPVAFEDLSALNEWMLGLVRVGAAYMLAGTGIADLAQATEGHQAETAAQIERNLIAFAPELGRYMDAQLAVQQAELDCVATRLAARPQDFAGEKAQGGLAKIRAGTAQTLTGVLTMLPISGLSEAWRRDRLPALQGIAPVAARLLLPEQLAALRQTAAEIGDTMADPAVAAGLRAFADALGKS
jgi:hypothetical protein